MGQLLFGKPKTKWTPPQDRPGFVNPFKSVTDKERLEAKALVIKKIFGTNSTLEEITAELAYQEYKKGAK